MAVAIRSCNLNLDHLCYQRKNTQVVGISHTYVHGLNHNKNKRSFRLNSSDHPNIDVIDGKKIKGVVLDDELYINLKKKNEEDPLQAYMAGKFIKGRYVYRQSFIIQSYEISLDKTCTMETVMNLLQEIALNHVTSTGITGNGFGATREMNIRNLTWVITRVHVQVNKYSSWGDVVEIDTWFDAAGKNGMRRDWIIRDYTTQKIITKATSTWVTMNTKTRKLSKIPDEVREELQPFFHHRHVLEDGENDTEKINKLTDETTNVIRSGLAPRWNDMDANQHVNNVKYIGWILESVPKNVLEDYDMTSMTVEYRRECRQENVIESLTSIKVDPNYKNEVKEEIDSTHLLRMQDDKAEIVRARTRWHSKIKLENTMKN